MAGSVDESICLVCGGSTYVGETIRFVGFYRSLTA
jgi:hypothetical protein